MVKKLLIASALLLGACSGGNYWSNWEPSVNHRATMIRCVDRKIDEDPKIECSSTNIDEQMFFCDRKGKEEVNYFDKFIKIYYLEDNKCMRDNTFYQPTKSDLKILLKTLWN